MAAGGDALARAEDGRVMFVEGALPGERVRVTIVEQRRDFLRGRTVEVVDASPDRVVPFCPHVSDGCGGCDWQHVSLSKQAELKRGVVVDSLRRIAKIDAADLVGIASSASDRSYRTTVRTAVVEGRAAYRRRSSHDLIVVGSCAVAHPLIERALVRGRFPGNDVVIRVEPKSGQLVVIVDGDVSEAILASDLDAVVLSVWPGIDESSLGTTLHEIDGVTLQVSARAFFQTHHAGAEDLVRVVDRAAGSGAVLVDLYGGVGLFAATVGRRFDRVVSVERNAVSSADAQENLASRSGASAVTADVDQWRCPSELAALDDVVVVADPARGGLGRAGVDAVKSCDADRVVLVSCDPASLGRDAGLLATAGFCLTRCELVDMFPHTSHVETVSTFGRATAEPASGGAVGDVAV